VTIVGFNMIFIPLFFAGLWGDHRRIYNYNHFLEQARPEIATMREIATWGLLIMIAAQVFFILNLIKTAFAGKKAEDNPYNANTLEWQCPSPPGHGNFSTMPTVYRGPYEYSVAGRDKDYWPQNEPG
jgi:cytochrome c oxidase subunit 1